MIVTFSISTLIQAKQELEREQKNLEKEKAAWASIRKTLDAKTAAILDQQVVHIFEESLFKYFQSVEKPDIRAILGQLQQLYLQGASASTLDQPELEGYNLADLIQDIPAVKDIADLPFVVEIIRLSIIADAAIYHQKAYVGNGGCTALELILVFLSWGLSDSSNGVNTQEHYQACYKIFYWLIETPTAVAEKYSQFDPYVLFTCLYGNGYGDYTAVAPFHDKVSMAMASLGFIPYNEWSRERWWWDIGTLAWDLGQQKAPWLPLFFPYEHELLQPFLHSWKKYLTPDALKAMINNFSGTTTGRKTFKTYFSQGPHWLTAIIIQDIPDIIFELVRRNEVYLLAPFLKTHKRKLGSLRNENGQSLLEYATATRNVKEKTIQLIREARLT
ncbi:hypothetical protein CLV59_104130 [Chitinophaga dinghuensis]|uniref:Uncharacterized protein n=1 Tax=Chitinophaga dinghuensis TaxID=1539050 RepID=A0A327W0Z6_9BACT|nr:hypothetical protein [Chitinophaga dinghuensis]RAJ81905.1 hypothetical protein CLV59_104130 [Chitinophaga dinghuensis]